MNRVSDALNGHIDWPCDCSLEVVVNYVYQYNGSKMFWLQHVVSDLILVGLSSNE